MKIKACTITIDLRDSEKENNKDTINNNLKVYIKKLNEKYNRNLVIPFEFRNGDEIIGSVASFREGYEIYRKFSFFMEDNDIEAYCGLGLGIIDTNLDYKINPITNRGQLVDKNLIYKKDYDLNLVNGSSIISSFRARDGALKKDFAKFEKPDEIKFFETKNVLQLFFYNNEGEIPYQILNYLAFEINAHWDKLSKIQKKALRVYEEHQFDISYSLLGDLLNYEKNPAQNARSILKNADAALFENKISIMNEMLDYVEKKYLYL